MSQRHSVIHAAIAAALLGAAVAVSCLPAPARAQARLAPDDDTVRVVISAVSPDSLEATVRGLEAFGTRYFSNTNHRPVAAWIRDRMLAAGLTVVQYDSFAYAQIPQTNVVGTLAGSKAGPEFVIGGHFDSISSDVLQAPGADDNASGTAAVIEMARAILTSGYVPNATMRFVAFAAEEVGLRGGHDFASRAQSGQRDIRAMFNFDMIGHRLRGQGDRDYYVVWYAGAENLARLDSAMARTYTTLTPVLTTSYRSGSDSYAFWLRGYPAVFHIERDFSPFYHSPRDVSDTLDFDYAAEITQTGLATLIRMDMDLAKPAVGTPVPGSVTLSQNFPNPFNAGTEIRFAIGTPGRVILTVHDMLGRELERLVDTERAAGLFTVRWVPGQAASGLYIARLTAGDRSESIRMVYIR